MRSLTCVSVVACVARKLRPCPSYTRRRDRINLGLWRSLYKGGGGGNRLILGCFGVAVPAALACTTVICRYRPTFSPQGTRFIVRLHCAMQHWCKD